jgi:F-type H+-transporting ATPase subunit gamma
LPNLRDIRKRIRSVKSTQQITRAMKMVAAARLRRAQEAALASRPYAAKMAEILGAVAARADLSAHPLFQPSPSRVVVVAVVTSDRGLCGGFNTNLAKAVARHVEELRARGSEVKLYPIGRKGRDYFRRRSYATIQERINVFTKIAYADARTLADEMAAFYLEGKAGEVVLAYNEFKSALAPRIVIDRLLPIATGDAAQPGTARDPQPGGIDYIYEPDPQTILAALVPFHLRTQLWRVLQESYAAELAARMAAMETATKNAGEMIDSLTLTMNKVRQAAITKELIEVVSGAAALR